MPGLSKVDGAWKNLSRLSVKVNGTWRQATAAFVKVNGQWRQWYASRIEDTFSRASTVDTLGNAESGQPWNVQAGTWYVNGTQQGQSDTSASTNARAVIDLGSSSFDAKMTTTGGVGLIFWSVDSNNWWAAVPRYSITNSIYESKIDILSSVNGTVSVVSTFVVNYSLSSFTTIGSISVKSLNGTVTVRAFSDSLAVNEIGIPLIIIPTSPNQGTSLGILKTTSSSNQGSIADNILITSPAVSAALPATYQIGNALDELYCDGTTRRRRLGFVKVTTATSTFSNEYLLDYVIATNSTACNYVPPPPPPPDPGPGPQCTVQLASITSVTPTSGPVGTTVLISGNFPCCESGQSVRVSNVVWEPSGYSSFSATQSTIAATVPAVAPGIYNVQVYNGCTPLLGAFTFTVTQTVSPPPPPPPDPGPGPGPVCGPCQAYTYTIPVCNGEDSYEGNFLAYRRTCTINGVFSHYDESGCIDEVLTGFGSCLASNVSSCGGSGGAGCTPCYTCTPTPPPPPPPPPTVCDPCPEPGAWSAFSNCDGGTKCRTRTNYETVGAPPSGCCIPYTQQECVPCGAGTPPPPPAPPPPGPVCSGSNCYEYLYAYGNCIVYGCYDSCDNYVGTNTVCSPTSPPPPAASPPPPAASPPPPPGPQYCDPYNVGCQGDYGTCSGGCFS